MRRSALRAFSGRTGNWCSASFDGCLHYAEQAPALAGPRSVLTLATELRKGTIDRIMAMSDLELGLQALLGTLPPSRA